MARSSGPRLSQEHSCGGVCGGSCVVCTTPTTPVVPSSILVVCTSSDPILSHDVSTRSSLFDSGAVLGCAGAVILWISD